jgi:DNA polymerase-4
MMQFNPAPPTTMLLDVNSCFATVEQQARPHLRGKPVAVAAYTTPGGCILAASREAKTYGVTTGMRVADGRQRCPQLVVLPSDPEKYRAVNHALVALLSSYTDDLDVASIDEMILSLGNTPRAPQALADMTAIAQEIKKKIKINIGEWITVSIGISTNQYLAKVASNLQKPDGLVAITSDNVRDVLVKMKLEDLPGIKEGNAGRLRAAGITSPLVMFETSPKQLTYAFHSRIGFDWWGNLHGWGVPWRNYEAVRSIGHSFALGKPKGPKDPGLHQILSQLVVKTGRRLRGHGFRAAGIHVSCMFVDYTGWRHGEKQPQPLFTNDDIYKRALDILLTAPDKPVRILAITCFGLSADLYSQQSLFAQDRRKEQLTRAIDAIEDRWGDFTITPARMLAMEQKVLDRIAFGGVR